MNLITEKVNQLINEAIRLENKGRTALAASFRHQANEIRKRGSIQVPSDENLGKWYSVSSDPANRILTKTPTLNKIKIIEQLKDLSREERQNIIESFGLAHLVKC